MGNRTREHLFSIFFILNIYTCMRGNKTSAKYLLKPPMVCDYLNVGIQDHYDGDDVDYVDEIMLEHLTT